MHQLVIKPVRIAALMFVTAIWAFGQETGFPLMRNYSPKEYKGEPQVFSVLQDHKTDIMYFAVYLEVISYDGVRWKSIPTPNNYSMTQDKNGRIYLSAIDEFGYLETDEQGKTEYKSLVPLLEDSTTNIGTVWSVKTTDHEVYFQSYETIFQYIPDQNKINVYKAGADGTFRGDFVLNNTYYVRLSEKGLVKVENDKVVPAPQSELFKGKNAFYTGSMPFTSSSQLVGTRTEGLLLYDITEDSKLRPFPIRDEEFLKDNDIYTASRLSENAFGLGSSKKGMLLIDREGNTLQHFNEEHLLQTNGIYYINSDKTQNIWLGLENGVSKTEHSPDLSYWDRNSGLKGTVTDLIRFQNRLYITTYQNVYYLDEKNKPQEIKEIPVGQNWVLYEFKAPDGKSILLAGSQYGIYEIENTHARKVHTSDHAFLLYQSKRNPNRLFSVDGDYFISLVYKNGAWVSEGRWAGISDYLLSITEDKDGDIWMGSLGNGIVRITPGIDDITQPQKVRYYTEKDGVPSLNSCIPYWFDDKIIWGTEKGLYIYNQSSDKFEPWCGLGKEFCDGSRGVAYLQKMPSGRVYISPVSNKKERIGYLEPDKKGSFNWVYKPFCRLPEIAAIIESGGMLIEDSGIAWIGGNEGLFRYDESKDTKNYDQSFRCLVRQVKVKDDSVVYNGDGTVVPSALEDGFTYKNNTLKFQFAAPFFDQEEKTLYSFQLEGFDKHWSPWGRQTEKEYTNLREGVYTFKVKAINVYDVESEVGSFQFRVLPPFYRTWWAYCIYVTTTALFIYGIVKLYTRSLINQKKNLEQIVKERTAEINSQNLQLNTLHATKDKFFSIISHDLRGPLHSLTSFSSLLLHHANELSKEEIQMVSQNLDKSLKNLFPLLDNLFEWSRSQNGMLEFTPDMLNLTEILQQCKQLLDGQAEQKNIRIINKAEQPLAVFANKNLLTSVFRNLISNAIKFTPSEGTITLDASLQGKEIVVTICDTGVGMTKEAQQKLFQLGIMHTTIGTAKEKGTGLGLILCKDFVEKSGGRIWVESEAGKGTTFFVSIPSFEKLPEKATA